MPLGSPRPLLPHTWATGQDVAHLIKREELDEWVEWHTLSKAAVGMTQTLTESLSEIIAS